jgi:hypothetical protein
VPIGRRGSRRSRATNHPARASNPSKPKARSGGFPAKSVSGEGGLASPSPHTPSSASTPNTAPVHSQKASLLR